MFRTFGEIFVAPDGPFIFPQLVRILPALLQHLLVGIKAAPAEVAADVQRLAGLPLKMIKG